MKKYILFSALAFSFSGYAQAEFEKIQITENVISTTAPFVNVQESSGVVNKITKTELQDAFYFATASALPVVGITDKLYITRDDNKLYRFNGTIYVPFSGGITSTATTNFIPKVNSGGNLENSIISQPVANRVDVAGNINLPTANTLVTFGGTTGLFPAIGKSVTANALIALKADNSDFVPLGYSQGNATMGYRTGSNAVYAFTNILGNPLQTGTVDTGLTRIGAGRVGVGNGTAGNTSGQIIAAKGLFNTSTDDGVNVGIFNGTISVATATQPNQAPRLEQVIQTTGIQSATGRKVFNSDNTTFGGITVLNSKTTGGSDAYGFAVYNTGLAGIYAENTTAGSTGDALRIANASNTGNGISVNNFGTGVGINLRNQGGAGDLLNAEVGTTRIQSTGRLQTTLAPTNGNDVVNLNAVKSRDGWASYSTTTYTNASPFTVSPNTTVTLPNNANNSITSDLPLGVTAFYNGTTNKITPVAIGDAYTVNVRFKATSTGALGNDYLELGLDIGSGSPVIKETQFFRGMGVEQYFNFVLPVFSLSTFVTNGGTLQITSHNGTLNIYDISYYINRNYTRQ